MLVVDNVSMFPEKALMFAADARQLGINLVVVGVGDYVDRQELRQIASSPSNFFHVATYEQLESLIERIIKALCRGGY